MQQLDAVRAIAVFAVFLEHLLPNEAVIRHVLPWGPMGVRCFFVLSGFLITGILLNCRDAVDTGQVGRGKMLYRFYARRCLRIFPPYYLVVAAMCLISPTIREYGWWFVAYLQNFLFWHEDKMMVSAHLWSLAVEEQFYLMWPFVVLFTPSRLLLPVIISTVFIGPIFRWIGVYVLDWSVMSTAVLPFAALDSLGMGSLLAWISVARASCPELIDQLTRRLLFPACS